MDFDTETINGFKKIITDGLAFNTFHQEDAFRDQTDGKHISIELFRNPPNLLETTLKLLKFYIEKGNMKSVIGFTENDPSLTIITTQACQGLKNMPLFEYDLENDAGAFSQFIRPEVVPCSLLIPYAIDEKHVFEIIQRFEQQKVPIKQVIAMINENPSKIEFSQEIEFVSISDWDSIKNRIKQFKNLTNEKMNELLTNFG